MTAEPLYAFSVVLAVEFILIDARAESGQPLLEASGEALGNYILAFMATEDKMVYMNKCIAWFTRLRVDLDFLCQGECY